MSEKAVAAAEGVANGKPIDYKQAGLDERYAAVARKAAKLKAAIDRAEEQYSGLRAELFETMVKAKIAGVTVDETVRVVVVKGRAGSKKIDAGRLRDLGVTADIIMSATVTGEPGQPYVQITVREAA